MNPEEQERPNILCEEILKEHDRDKFNELVKALNDLLDDEGQSLKGGPARKQTDAIKLIQ